MLFIIPCTQRLQQGIFVPFNTKHTCCGAVLFPLERVQEEEAAHYTPTLSTPPGKVRVERFLAAMRGSFPDAVQRLPRKCEKSNKPWRDWLPAETPQEVINRYDSFAVIARPRFFRFPDRRFQITLLRLPGQPGPC